MEVMGQQSEPRRDNISRPAGFGSPGLFDTLIISLAQKHHVILEVLFLLPPFLIPPPPLFPLQLPMSPP